MVGTVFSRSSRSSSTIRPVELGRRLLREMDDHRSVDVKGRRIVPNSFVFHLSPRDHAGFAEIEHALIHELGEAAREYARDEGYHFVGPVEVEIVVDNALKAGRFGIGSSLREGNVPAAASTAAPEPVMQTPAAPVSQPSVTDDHSFAIVEAPQVVDPFASAAVAPASAPAHVAPAYEPAPEPFVPGEPPRLGASVGRLQLPSGERVTVGHRLVTLGRLPECTVSLNDPNVSRRHAEIRPGREVTIVDLGSTNGTKVNGLRIDGERVLVDGDIISLGSSHLRFEASTASA
jgi:hypothetical protein